MSVWPLPCEWPPMQYHISLPTLERQTIYRDRGELLQLVHRLVVPDRLLFSVADDHLHVVDEVARPAHRARDLARSVRAICDPIPLGPPHVRLVKGRSDLEGLVRYLVRQPSKHGLATPDALWPGSCFLDLIGARRLPGFSGGALAAALPKFRGRDLLPWVGLAGAPLVPVSDDRLRELGVGRILRAAGDVLGVLLKREGRARPDAITSLARALAFQTAEHVGFSVAAVQTILPLHRNSLARLRRQQLDPALFDALRMRLALEEVVAKRALREAR